jgi:hypothetical protein
MPQAMPKRRSSIEIVAEKWGRERISLDAAASQAGLTPTGLGEGVVGVDGVVRAITRPPAPGQPFE